MTDAKKPWWLSAGVVPEFAFETGRDGWEFYSNSYRTEFFPVGVAMTWGRCLTPAEVAHVYENNTDGKRCDCQLCTEGRKEATK